MVSLEMAHRAVGHSRLSLFSSPAIAGEGDHPERKRRMVEGASDSTRHFRRKKFVEARAPSTMKVIAR
jgi:hypothetical protein